MSDKIAIEGGEPVRRTFLPFHRPLLGREEEEEVLDTLRSGWLTTGPKTKRFEERFARYTGTAHAIGTSSCTAALHIALTSLGIGTGDEVITPSLTFPSAVNVIFQRGATPIFADIDPDTLCVSPGAVEEAVTPRTRAVVPMHFAGHPCDMASIMDIAGKRGLSVVEDAAHAIEATYGDRKIGSIGDVTAFSFYATKNITTGEGGMLTTNDARIAERASILTLHGLTSNAWRRYGGKTFSQWEVLTPGYKYNMSDIQASLGLHQLNRIDDFWERRRALSRLYREGLEGEENVLLQADSGRMKHSHHLFVIRVRTERLSVDRDAVAGALRAEGIGVSCHFPSMHLQPFYRQALSCREGQLPRTEYASERVISLPLYPSMREEDVDDVLRAVKKVLRYYRKSRII